MDNGKILNMNEMNLMTIMGNDVEFGKRIAKKVIDIKEDKRHIMDAAQEYNKRYEREVNEGNELRNRLITEGTKQGLSEAEILGNYAKFVPCLRTPILNFLYFILRESDNDQHYGNSHYEKRNKINEYLIEHNKMVSSDNYDNVDLTEQDAERILNKFIDNTFAPRSTNIRQEINSIFDNEDRVPTELKEPENMEDYLYGSLTLSQFDVLKKLKALTTSDNLAESTLAFKKGKELCMKYELNWEKIPCYVEKKNNK